MPDSSASISKVADRVPLIEVQNLTVRYEARRQRRGKWSSVTAVDDVTLLVDRSEVLGLVGETGCGKSSLGKAILGLTPAAGGRVLFDGIDVYRAPRSARAELRRRTAMVFQDSRLSLNPRRTVGQIVAEPLKVYQEAHGRTLVDRVVHLLTEVGLSAADVQRYPHELSGGQRQRVGIARAIALRPQFIVCDEPTSSLDVSVQAQVLNLLLDLRDQFDLGYLFISHDLAMVRQFSDRVAVMMQGRIVEIGSAREILDAPRHPYTISLCQALRSAPADSISHSAPDKSEPAEPATRRSLSSRSK